MEIQNDRKTPTRQRGNNVIDKENQKKTLFTDRANPVDGKILTRKQGNKIKHET